MTTKQLGRIKWFNTTKGFGFVTDCHSNEDVFVHHSGIQVQSNCWKSLYPGEYVHYEVQEAEGKTQAVNITGVEGGPLLCETRHQLNEQRKEHKERQQSTHEQTSETD